MGDSLKDQLIALGLAKPVQGKERARKQRGKGARKAGAKPAGHAGAKGEPKRGAAPVKPDPANVSLDEAYRLREREELRAVEQKKLEKLEQDRIRREINAKIQALVDELALNDAAAELKRNFLYKGRIRSVLVTPAQLKALNAGQLGLVFVRGSYYVMQPEHVEQARAISADHIPDLGTDTADNAEEEFPVPDDLMW